MEYKKIYKAPYGRLLLCSDGEYLTGLSFERADELAEQSGESPEILRETEAWLNIYFSGREPDFMPRIKLSGTDFRMAVWDILRTIPYGETVTYGEIAHEIAEKEGIARMSAQAVGGAVGHNPIGIIVPCHRVVGAGGRLTGFGGGMEWKKSLLSLEGIDVIKFSMPRSFSCVSKLNQIK